LIGSAIRKIDPGLFEDVERVKIGYPQGCFDQRVKIFKAG